MRIVSPVSGSQVDGARGVRIEGDACGLSNESAWLFDYDYGSKSYYEDYGDSPGPIVSRNGKWTFINSPIGNKGDDRVKYTLTLVLASPDCNGKLRAIKPDGTEYSISEMPPGCVIAQGVDVYVTY
ncbi:hypothetical protein [Streptomyces sp. RKAG293]|uniref:hypothetical protein n=1 Tax=Streptomyces sp. RKAG293 TaxID=2893403 RepID=UPI002033543B|nr:hypothetical protein [Streptomyces sp. RKAG293]MCM2417736.1 hypothetical protein [Streptomyces sp. RKAG293]